jgi:hypothetical protein
MNEVAAALVAEFETAARTVQQSKDALRKRMVEEVAELERRRAFAFRRANVVRASLSRLDTVPNVRPEGNTLGWTLSCVMATSHDPYRLRWQSRLRMRHRRQRP